MRFSPCIFALLLLLQPALTRALESPGTELQEAGITPNRGAQVDTTLTFSDSNGRNVALRELMLPARPVLLIPAYYECPRLCGLLLEGTVKALNGLDLVLGQDYSVITVSFNAAETPSLAAEKAAQYRAQLLRPEGDGTAWHFLVGKEESITPLMQSIGFRFLPDRGEFAHAATLVVLTPDGKISQYLTGVTFPSFDLRLALVEAAKGKIGSALDHVLLFCFRFDPTKGKYTWAAWNFMRLAGIATLLFLAGLIIKLLLRERRLARTASGD